MPTYYLDSSALVKRYVEEAGTERLLEFLEGANRIIVSRLALVEVTAALARRARRVGMPPEQIAPLFDALESELRARFEVVELGTRVLTRATDLARVYALRAADAIQLACALIARGDRTAEAELVLVSSDSELNSAARQEEFEVIDPAES